MATIKKACKGVSYPKSSSVSKRLGSPSKAKNGKSFPDLNKDGKITKADILKGRGVIAKKGMKVKKAQNGAREKYESSTSPKLKGFNPADGNMAVSIDTSGYAAGKKSFPTKLLKSGNYTSTGRAAVKGTMKQNEKIKKEGRTFDEIMENRAKSKQRTGGVTKKSSSSKMKTMKTGGKMTKKCMYGCK